MTTTSEAAEQHEETREERIARRDAEQQAEWERKRAAHQALERAADEVVATFVLPTFNDEFLDEIKDAIDRVLRRRDLDREWTLFDKFAASIGDEVVFLDKHGVERKGKITDIDAQEDEDVPRDWYPSYDITSKGLKTRRNVYPSKITRLTKTVTP